MTTEKKGCLAFAVCGSFCTLEDALGAAQALTAQGWTLLPVMSFAAQQDTRFGTGKGWRQRLQAVTGQPVLDTLQAVEPLGEDNIFMCEHMTGLPVLAKVQDNATELETDADVLSALQS